MSGSSWNDLTRRNRSRASTESRMSRRQFVAGSVAMAAVASNTVPALAAPAEPKANPIAAFTKFLKPMPPAALAEAIAGLGFDGIEATVRAKGQIEPTKASDDLPLLVEHLAKHDLELLIMATDITRADAAGTEKLLKLASSLGIKRYRMGYYHYDLGRAIQPQLATFRPMIRDVAAMNRDLGIQAVYQNHAGARNVGATVWDIVSLLDGIPTEEIGLAFDVRHAVAEAGLAWPVFQKLAEPHMEALYVKDCHWQGERLANTPLGKGRVDRDMVRRCKPAGFQGPLSLHVEYVAAKAVEPHLDALGHDLTTLRQWLTAP